MGEVLACRICLSTEKKLYNIFKYNLEEAYEAVSQILIQNTDQLPHFVCSICRRLLDKYAEFNALCDISRNLLLQVLQKKQHLLTEDVETIESKYNIVNLTLTKLPNISIIDENIKEECETRDVDANEYKIEHLDIIDENIYRKNQTNLINTAFLYSADIGKGHIDNNYENFNNKVNKTESFNDNFDEISIVYNEFDENESVNDDNSEDVNGDLEKNENFEFFNRKQEKDVNKPKLDHEIDSDEEPLSKVVKNTLKYHKKDRISAKLLKINKNTLKSVKSLKKDRLFRVKKEKIDILTDFDADIIDLTKEQQLAEVQERKKSSNYLYSKFKCEFCFKGFKSDITYKNHMLLHDSSSGNFICDICHIRCLNMRRLRTHISSSHQRNYVCRKCAHVCKTTNKAREHYDWHQGKKFVCKICDSVFNKSTSYYSHIRIHHPTENCCSICGEAFIGPVGLMLHVKKSHRVGAITMKAKTNFCKKCKVHFRHVDAYSTHIEHCDGNIKSCAHCGEGFQNEVILKEHSKIHRIKSNQQYSCKQCNKTFSSFYQSRLCHKTTKNNNDKIKDVTKGAFVCEYCGKVFDVQSKLKQHQAVHNRTKSFQCTRCLKYYTTMEGLKIHTRTHTKERPFKCEICPKDFIHKAALNRHARVHTGSKPYTCQYCGKSFSQSNSMKVHIKTVHFKMPAPYRNKKIDKNDCNILLSQ